MVASSHCRASMVLGVESGSGCLPSQEEMSTKHDIVASGRDISCSGWHFIGGGWVGRYNLLHPFLARNQRLPTKSFLLGILQREGGFWFFLGEGVSEPLYFSLGDLKANVKVSRKLPVPLPWQMRVLLTKGELPKSKLFLGDIRSPCFGRYVSMESKQWLLCPFYRRGTLHQPFPEGLTIHGALISG